MELLLTIEGVGDRVLRVGDETTTNEVLEAAGASTELRAVVTRTNQELNPGAPLSKLDIRSGDIIKMATPTVPRYSVPIVANSPRHAAAIVRILTGPRAPAAIELGFGEFTVGRGLGCDITILDESMSRKHATIVVEDDSVEIVDLGSHNGVVVDGERRVGPVTITDDTKVRLGETWIQIEHLGRVRGLGDAPGGSVPFNRPPRVVKPYEPQRSKVPTPPEHPPRQRIPMITALVPVFMAAVLVFSPTLFGRPPNYGYGLFMMLSPVMIIASYFERRSAGRSAYRQALEAFNTAMDELEERLARLKAEEEEGRRAAAPAAGDMIGIVQTLSPRMWERGPEDSDVLSVRIGLADLPSQNEIELHGNGPKDLRERIEELPRKFGQVHDVPMLANLAVHRGLGISGPQASSLPLAAALMGQLATLHSPAELLLAAMVPTEAKESWDWLKWLPHCPMDESILGGHQLAADETACRSLLHRLLSLAETRGAKGSGGWKRHIDDPLVVVLISEGLAVEQNELTRLLEFGPDFGIYVIWLSPASRRVPRSLGQVVQIEASGTKASVGTSSTGVTVTDVSVETLNTDQAEALARLLSPIDDVSARFSTESRIPTSVPLVELLGGVEILEDSTRVIEAWKRRPKTLEAPVGRLADKTFTLDIRRDGPHGLVGGTTGAGKSEFLQSWVMSMAATHSPATVTFLLVDYKGGAAFKDCSKLPHTVGMVTDLDNAGVRRALVSLRAELHYREILLAKHDCSDLLEMIDRSIPDTPPSLLIIVDEFAALVQEVPEFVTGMVDVAQRGRSLGLHLVLATQRPAGVITPQVRANTDLRIALRMADSEDSVDVIDSPDAADIDRRIPGRAIARISRDRFSFQSAYVGGVTTAEEVEDPVELATLEFGNSTPLVAANIEQKVSPVYNSEAEPVSDLERMVANFCEIHTKLGLPLPRKPWLPPLDEVYDVAELKQPGMDERITIGMVDRPDHQSQEPLYFEPDVDGSFAFVGIGGSGKTVALRTLAAAAAFNSNGPDQLPIFYAIDFGGRGLRVLEDLPHVGTIAYDDDIELIRRLLADLSATIDQRAEMLSAVRASSLTEYRASGATEPLKRIYLLIDNYPSLHEAIDGLEQDRYVKILRRIMVDGRQVGIHLVFTTPRRDAVSFMLSRAVGKWMIMRQSGVDEYRSLDAPVDILNENSPPGRVIDGTNMAQIALLGTGQSTDEQASALAHLGRELVANGAKPAPQVRLLPDVITVGELGDPAALGLRDSDFTGQYIPEGFRTFVVSGPRLSGRTTALGAVARVGLASKMFDEVVFITPKRLPFPVDPAINVLVGTDAAEEFITEVVSGFSASEPAADQPRRLILVDDAPKFTSAGLPLDQVSDHADGEHLALAVVLEDNNARSSYDVLVRSVTAGKLGLMLRPHPLDDSDVYGVAMPRIRSHLWPEGRGYFVQGQSIVAVQVAV